MMDQESRECGECSSWETTTSDSQRLRRGSVEVHAARPVPVIVKRTSSALGRRSALPHKQHPEIACLHGT